MATNPRKPPFRRRLTALLLSFGLWLILVPPFLIPVDGPVTSPFFWRFAPDKLMPAAEFHDAIDIGAPQGSKVKATAFGRVVEAGWNSTAGNYLQIRHAAGFSSYYAHLAELKVKQGDLILLPAIQTIALSGSTGRATGPHLHFGIKFRNRPVSPQILLVFHRVRKAVLRF